MKVSVLMITYNHEKFIAQAIESALVQETNFEYEIVIGEDCSTDSTREIVIDYAQKYPDRIRLLLHKDNLGARGVNNFIATYSSCLGQYIAILEGDDYWASPFKLQAQVDLLDNSPQSSMCFHNAYNLEANGSTKDYIRRFNIAIKDCYFLEDIIKGNFIPTCSVMFRNHLLRNLPAEFYKTPTPDALLHVIFAQQGQLAYIDEIWGFRRVHEGGIISMKPQITKLTANIESLEIINRYLKFHYETIIRPIIIDYEDKLQKEKVFEAYHSNNFFEVRHQFLNALRCHPHWLKDIAFCSVALDAFVGKRTGNFLRSKTNIITSLLITKGD